MFESRYVIRPTGYAMESPSLQRDYWRCWQGLEKRFTGA
jgi:homogentisate 1,2-dioxygenase